MPYYHCIPALLTLDILLRTEDSTALPTPLPILSELMYYVHYSP